MKKNLIIIFGLLISLAGCSPQPASSTIATTQTPNTPISSNIIVRGKAVFEISGSSGSQASVRLIKNSYANGPQLDITDVSVTNAPLVQFSVSPDSTSSNNFQVDSASGVGIVSIPISLQTLNDNDLHICTSNSLCQAAQISVYTENLDQRSGLESGTQSLALTVITNDPSSLLGSSVLNNIVDVQYNSPVVLQNVALNSGLEQLTKSAFYVSGNPSPIAPIYTLQANMNGAGSGAYTSRVVFEYELIGPALSPVYVLANCSVYNNGVLLYTLPSCSQANSISVSGGNVYVAGQDSSSNAAVWKNAINSSSTYTSGTASTSFAGNILNVGSDVYVSGFDGQGNVVFWKNGNKTIISTAGTSGVEGTSMVLDSTGNVHVYWRSLNGSFLGSIINGTLKSSVSLSGVFDLFSLNLFTSPQKLLIPSIVIDSNGVLYFGGNVDSYSGYTSVNASGTVAVQPNIIDNTSSNVYSTFNDSSGNVYLVGSENNSPTVWTGVLQPSTEINFILPKTKFSSEVGQIAIGGMVSSTGDVYVLLNNGDVFKNNLLTQSGPSGVANVTSMFINN